jgi:dihydrolipoamide dehydrogenase
VIVIGGGPVGENVAERVVKGGLQAILIEAELVGGECSYWACMPSKALLRPGAALEAARRVGGAAQAVTGTLDVQAVLDRRTSFTENWDDAGQVEWLFGAGISLVRGRGRISGDRAVEVTTNDGSIVHLRARHAVVLATGSIPQTPPIEGLDSVAYWGTREATSARSVPARLTVLGGGVSGTEMAQVFSRLGSNVTIVARSGLLGMFPKQASDLLLAALRDEGIDVRVDTVTKSVSQDAGGTISLVLGNGEIIVSDALLVSTGRKPALANLGLEDLGLGDLKLAVGDDGRVANVDGGWLYAVGDAAGKVLLTHQGKYEARLTGDAIAARAAGTLGDRVEPWSQYAATADVVAVPQVVYTDPELVMVGRTAQQATDAGIRVKTVEIEMAVAGTSLHADGYKGWAQIVVDEDRRVIVGVTLAGQDVSEMLHAATIAIVGEVPLDRLWHAVPAYPTMSEIWLRLLEAYGL